MFRVTLIRSILLTLVVAALVGCPARAPQPVMTAGSGPPCVSPNGLEIVYSTHGPAYSAASANDLCQLFVLDRATGQSARLTTSTAEETWPAFSPSGLVIAYSRLDSDGRHIWVFDRGVQHERQLTFGRRDDYVIQFAGPASSIYFNRRVASGGLASLWQLCKVDAVTGVETTVSLAQVRLDGYSAIAPNETFALFGTKDFSGNAFDIQSSDLATGRVQKISSGGSDPSLSSDQKRVISAGPESPHITHDSATLSDVGGSIVKIVPLGKGLKSTPRFCDGDTNLIYMLDYPEGAWQRGIYLHELATGQNHLLLPLP